jgi:hypothetical protein
MTQRSDDFPAGEPWSVERQLQFDQQKRDADAWAASLRNRDPNESERNLRALSDEDKEALRRAGYRGNLSPITGEDSGLLTRKVVSRPSYVETYEGDPGAWMNQFMWPVKLQQLSIRNLHETDSAWQARQVDNQRNFAMYGQCTAPKAPRTVNDGSAFAAKAAKDTDRARFGATPSYTS